LKKKSDMVDVSLDASLLMNPDIVAVEPETNVSEVARVMLEKNIGSVAVKESDRIVGIITDRDFTRCAAMEKQVCKAKEIMSSPVITVDHRESATDIARKMGEHRIRHIFVEKDGEIVGIISLRDVLKICPEAIYCYIPYIEKGKR